MDDLGVFAYFAFVEGLEGELTARWEKLQGDTYWAIDSPPVMEKYKPFQKFFNDAEVLVMETIHEYFQPLLKIAITHRRHLRNKSPLATLAEWLDWTESQILSVVCNFLGMDERLVEWAGSQNQKLRMSLANSWYSDSKFDPASESRNDSRFLASSARLTGAEWVDNEGCSEFLLPRWTQSHHPVLNLRHPKESPQERSAWDAKFEAERMSRAETMQWVKQVEISFSRNIAIQIHKDRLDGQIYAGRSDLARRPREKRVSNQYHSALKRHIKNCLTNDPEATALQVCGYIDEQDINDIPSGWLKNGNRELTVAYRNDKKARRSIDAQISKVKRDLKASENARI
jgi:hypothetical protein